jgi:hypothetical protein
VAENDRWFPYGADEISLIPRAPSFWDDPRERECPRCHAIALRTYGYGSSWRATPSLISYVWCPRCRRCAGSTGPRPSGFEFTDPLGGLSDDERKHLFASFGNGMQFLGYLDGLWEEGKLPQRRLTG